MRKQLLIVCLALLSACASGGASPIDLSKLPPIVIGVPDVTQKPPAEQPPVPAPKPRATLAFQVVDEATGVPIPAAFVKIAYIVVKQVNDDGYLALELEAGGAIYSVTFEADDYATSTRMFQLEANRQFTVKLKSTKPAPETPAPTGPPTVPVPTVPPPVVPVDPMVESAGWSNEQWRVYVMALLARSGGALVNDASMKVARPDLNARGVDFQNGWRGDLRPRLFLPVPGCPPATRADVPLCSYNRTVDLGQYGEAWSWIVR